MNMNLIIINEDGEVVLKNVDNLKKYEFLEDVCGDNGLGAVDFQPDSVEMNVAKFLDSFDGDDDTDLNVKIDQFEKTIKGKKGFSLWYCSVGGEDSILGFIEGSVEEVLEMYEEVRRKD